MGKADQLKMSDNMLSVQSFMDMRMGARAMTHDGVAFAQREPLLTWAPTPKKTHPMDYFVPNFGEDSDIASTKGHESAAEATLKHVWTPTKDKDGNWEVPSTEAFFRLAQKKHQ